MVTHMKTTIEISEPLLESAKREARRRGLTLRAMVEEGLRRVVADSTAGGEFALRKASFRGKGLHSGVVEGRWDVVRDLIYEGRGG